MNLKKTLFASFCVFGFGMAASAGATTYSGMHNCCKLKQNQCLIEGGDARVCAAVYNDCMAGNRCFVW